MEIIKKSKYLLVLVIFLLSACSCFENKDYLARRMAFYSKLSKYSNGTMRVGHDQYKGLYCVANEHIEPGQMTIKTPKELSLCPYSMFPFKFEITEALDKVPGLISTIGIEQKYGVYLATYYLMYYKSAPKEAISRYIHENNLSQYYNITQIDDSLKDSFPNVILGASTMLDEHYALLKELGFPVDKNQEMETVFKHVLQSLFKSEHFEMIFPWVSNFADFKWAYGMIMSRGMTVRLNEYYIVEKLKNNMDTKKMEPWAVRNLEISRHFMKNTGAPCIVAYIDLCNHYQPKYVDMRDKKPIILDTVPDNYVNTLATRFEPGDEIAYTYSMDPSNLIMYLHYGFTMKNNIFNIANLKVEDDAGFTAQQFNVCRELGCLESSIKDPSRIPRIRFYRIRHTNLDQNLINYGRVKFLKGEFNPKKVVKSVLNYIPINYLNEVNAYLWYYVVTSRSAKEDKNTILRSIRKAQYYKDLMKPMEASWTEEEYQTQEWARLKQFEQIYLVDISYKIIVHKHIKAALGHVIQNTYNEINKIKFKYLDTK